VEAGAEGVQRRGRGAFRGLQDISYIARLSALERLFQKGAGTGDRRHRAAQAALAPATISRRAERVHCPTESLFTS
jgi:hypothetical protein